MSYLASHYRSNYPKSSKFYLTSFIYCNKLIKLKFKSKTNQSQPPPITAASPLQCCWRHSSAPICPPCQLTLLHRCNSLHKQTTQLHLGMPSMLLRRFDLEWHKRDEIQESWWTSSFKSVYWVSCFQNFKWNYN